MTYTIACGDVMPGCSSVLTGESREAVMAAVAQHAEADHGVTEIDDATRQQVDGAIRETA